MTRLSFDWLDQWLALEDALALFELAPCESEACAVSRLRHRVSNVTLYNSLDINGNLIRCAVSHGSL